jgi:H+-transporting ATPase
MPTVLSVTMAVGARLLVKKEAGVSRLVAIEAASCLEFTWKDFPGNLMKSSQTKAPTEPTIKTRTSRA